MNRRGFLTGLVAVAGAVAAEELWVPGKKLISIPSNKRFITCRNTMTGTKLPGVYGIGLNEPEPNSVSLTIQGLNAEDSVHLYTVDGEYHHHQIGPENFTTPIVFYQEPIEFYKHVYEPSYPTGTLAQPATSYKQAEKVAKKYFPNIKTNIVEI